ncbi:mandelate racemase/muconate lactonizing enzyme family protein [Pseudonocardia sp. WMMC193]|uniref:mandelate racemase/muconate lactonizing enzyme family protein n=1 Tax=Pseudonocardia sp. WMMC193 TaxID=2911965 RepID=UPI001F1F5CD4|nr:mandelate racemase/muconate lactonizing enzyme family protein [Pseudonocardia sp. WMMC193]MCF7549468.1 mandelate racemase/muconate lactonizing enzyme family protein [Pseudonocardia sp. WMMC193]
MSMSTRTIERAEVRLVDLPLGSARGGSGATRLQLALVTLVDADGAQGTGYSYSLGPGMGSVVALLEELHLPAVVGSDPDDWARGWYRMRDATHRLGTGIPLLATSAVDIAMWDLRSVRAGQPLYRFLGAQREEMPVYGSGRATHAMTTEELVEGARSYVDEGFPAVKLRVGVRAPADDVARVAAVRAAVGDDVAIMVDANERLDLPTAQWMAPRLLDLGVVWFEEPVPSRHPQAHRSLSTGPTPPLAVGEHVLGLAGFTEFVDSASVWMPDAPLTGGVSEFLRIDALAEAHGVSVTPHFLPELHVHLVAAGRATTWLEHFPLLDDLLAETLTIKDGVTTPPDRPGHGLRFDEGRVGAHTVRSVEVGPRGRGR